MIRRFTAVCALLLAAAPVMAGVRGSELPASDPKDHWRKLTYDDATSTSRCIGKRETPICAVETFLACMLRGQDDLCPTPRREDDPPRVHGSPDEWRKYRVISAGRFKEGDPHVDDRLDHLRWVPGDVWIVLDDRECHPDRCNRPHPKVWRYLLRRYIVHKRADGWVVVQSGPLHWTEFAP